jgi:hypothetical protein
MVGYRGCNMRQKSNGDSRFSEDALKIVGFPLFLRLQPELYKPALALPPTERRAPAFHPILRAIGE